MYTFTDLCHAHSLYSWTPLDIEVTLLTTLVTITTPTPLIPFILVHQAPAPVEGPKSSRQEFMRKIRGARTGEALFRGNSDILKISGDCLMPSVILRYWVKWYFGVKTFSKNIFGVKKLFQESCVGQRLLSNWKTYLFPGKKPRQKIISLKLVFCTSYKEWPLWRPLVSNNVTSIRETLESNKASKFIESLDNYVKWRRKFGCWRV